MYTEVVQYSTEPAAVTMLKHPDGTAEYRLAADVVHEKDNDGNDVIHGREVYFEIPATEPQPTAADVAENFDHYWQYGMKWPVEGPSPKTTEERIAELEADSLTALEAVAELYEMLLQ